MQREFGLVVGVLGPGATSSDVGRTIVEHDFSLMLCQGGSEARAVQQTRATFCCFIACFSA